MEFGANGRRFAQGGATRASNNFTCRAATPRNGRILVARMPSSCFLAEVGILYVHGLPNWLFCLLTVTGFVVFSLGGQILVRPQLPRWFGEKDYNEIVGQYLSAAGVFFGITLGLLSVATWEISARSRPPWPRKPPVSVCSIARSTTCPTRCARS
jgi:hypothetical protein